MESARGFSPRVQLRRTPRAPPSPQLQPVPGTLHITNGDSVQIGSTGLGGEVLFWRDVLHEGPVPAGLPLEKLTAVRAKFLARYGDQGQAEILERMRARDRTLANFSNYQEVVLWFEHDLYDQLQLLQILDWFAEQTNSATMLSLIQADQYLGPLKPDQLATLSPGRHPITAAEFKLARRAWSEFRSPAPTGLVQLLEEDMAALPFLRAAIARHLEQFPSAANGLSRTERQMLEIVESGVSRVSEIFRADQAKEERIFMGDLPFYSYIQGLVEISVPLLEIIRDGNPFGKTDVRITPRGRKVLHNEEDHIRLNGIHRWLGGVRLQGTKAWRWASSGLTPPA